VYYEDTKSINRTKRQRDSPASIKSSEKTRICTVLFIQPALVSTSVCYAVIMDRVLSLCHSICHLYFNCNFVDIRFYGMIFSFGD